MGLEIQVLAQTLGCHPLWLAYNTSPRLPLQVLSLKPHNHNYVEVYAYSLNSDQTTAGSQVRRPYGRIGLFRKLMKTKKGGIMFLSFKKPPPRQSPEKRLLVVHWAL